MFGIRTRKAVILDVRNVIDAIDAIDPDGADCLAKSVLEVAHQNQSIILDFARIGTVSTSFANALFLRLAELKPIERWRDLLEFQGMTSVQRDVIARCLRAVRNASGSRK